MTCSEEMDFAGWDDASPWHNRKVKSVRGNADCGPFRTESNDPNTRFVGPSAAELDWMQVR